MQPDFSTVGIGPEGGCYNKFDMRKLNLVIATVILLALAGVGLLVVKNNSADKQPQPATQPEASLDEAVKKNQVQVEYTEAGFSPSTTAVPLGATVVFTNNSTKSMWVASDVHPTHNVYSEFDAKKGIGTGQSYEFTFDKKGSWSYHNHLVPSDAGVVVVE